MKLAREGRTSNWRSRIHLKPVLKASLGARRLGALCYRFVIAYFNQTLRIVKVGNLIYHALESLLAKLTRHFPGLQRVCQNSDRCVMKSVPPRGSGWVFCLTICDDDKLNPPATARWY